MAPKPVGTLKQAIAQANALSKQMAGERAADYQMASSALTAGSINLGKQTQAITRNLVLSQKQNRAAIAALNAKGVAQGGVVAGQAAAARNAYGSGLGKAVAQSFSGAAAQAASTAMKTGAGVKASGAAARTGALVAGIASQGVQAQKAAAAFALNQALQQRTLVDNQTIAGLEGQLYQTAIQYNQQFKEWKKQQNYATTQAQKAGNTQLANLASSGALSKTGLAAWQAYDAAWQAGNGDLSGQSITTIAQKYATEMGYAPSDPRVTAFIGTLQNMWGTDPSKVDTTQALADAVNTSWGGTKGWDQVSGPVLGAIKSDTYMQFQSYYNTPGAPGYDINSTATSATAPDIKTAIATWNNNPDKNAALQQLKDAGWSDNMIENIVMVAAGKPAPYPWYTASTPGVQAPPATNPRGGTHV